MLNFINLGSAEMILILLSVPLLIVFLLALVKCISNKSLTSTERVVWLLIIFIAPLLGPIVYFVVNGYNRKEVTQQY